MKKFLLPVFASFMIFSGIGATSAEAATTAQLTTEASKYIGVKYVYGGTSTSGFDCSGYTQYVFNKLGISIPRTTGSQFSTGTSVAKANLQVGDLVFFNTTGKTASHVGIFVGNGKFAHAGTSTGVTIAKLSDSYWSTRYTGARRVANFTNEVPVAATAHEVKAPEIDFSIYASRGEVALHLVSALGLDTTNTNSPFSDVPSSSKYAGAVTALYNLGVFTGDEAGKFNPNDPLTREQMAKVLVEAYNLMYKGTTIQFDDVKANAWSYDYIQNLASNGVTNGIGDNLYGTTQNVKYSELELFIERASK